MSGNGSDRNGGSSQFELAFEHGNGVERIGDSPRIRVSARARRLAIRVFPDARVEVVVPPRARPREVERFISAHREWIDSRRAAALRNRPVPQPFPPAAIEFRVSDERWRLHLAGGTDRIRLAESGPDARLLRVTGAFSNAGLRTALRAWLLRAARNRLTTRVAALAASTSS